MSSWLIKPGSNLSEASRGVPWHGLQWLSKLLTSVWRPGSGSSTLTWFTWDFWLSTIPLLTAATEDHFLLPVFVTELFCPTVWSWVSGHKRQKQIRQWCYIYLKKLDSTVTWEAKGSNYFDIYHLHWLILLVLSFHDLLDLTCHTRWDVSGILWTYLTHPSAKNP